MNNFPPLEAFVQGSESSRSVEKECDLVEDDPHPEQEPDCHVIVSDDGTDGHTLESDPDQQQDILTGTSKTCRHWAKTNRKS